MTGREKAKRRRKRRMGAGVVTEQPRPAAPPAKSKDDIARDRLVPLREGERPTVVTVAAIVAAAIAIQATLMLTAAIGMWYGRYWAVLGFQTLLAVFIVIVSLSLVKAESIAGVLLAGALIAAAGTLFWLLVKALARLQMPERRPPHSGG